MIESSAIAIHCRNVCKKFGDVPAVCGVDLEVREGQFLALLGPSGCGKTTMLRLLAGLETVSRGEIEIGRRPVSAADLHVPAEQRRVGMVFQEYALFPHLNVLQNVRYGLSSKTDPAPRIEEVLRLVGLEGVKDRMPHELSGGQQQRVALARALAPRPDVILLDEPFSNLDAGLRVRVRADVRHILREAQVTAIFVTHDQEEALSLADQVAVMMEGRILQTDTPQNIYRKPASHQVATFLGEANFIPGRAREDGVECELGLLKTDRPYSGEVEVMFRPEDLSCAPDEQGAGRVVDLEYFGHDQLIKVQLESGTVLRSRYVGSNGNFRKAGRVRVRVESPVLCYPSRYGCPVLPKMET